MAWSPSYPEDRQVGGLTTAHSSLSGALLAPLRLPTVEARCRQGTEKAVPALRSPFYQAPGTPLRPPGRTPDAPLQQSNQRFITWRSPTSPAHSQDELSHPNGVRHSAPAWGPPCLCTLPSAASSPRQMPRPGSVPIHPSGTTAPRVLDPPFHLGGAQGQSELRLGAPCASRFPHRMRSLNLQLPPSLPR